MLEKILRLNNINDVKKFVALTSTKDYKITLESDDFIVDAKSIMGVLSLDLTKPLKLKAYSDTTADFLREIEPFLWHLLGNLK